MTPSFDEVIAAINTFRRMRGHLTNLFLTPDELRQLLLEPSAQVVLTESLLVLSHEEDGLVRVHFYAGDADALGGLAALLPADGRPVVVDVVGRQAQARATGEVLARSGFDYQSTFVRLTARPYSVGEAPPTGDVRLARPSELAEILGLIEGEFDRLNAHIPPPSEVEEAISRSEVFVVDRGDGIEGVAYFQVTGPRDVVLRYFVVRPSSRGQRIGNMLLAYAQQVHPDDVRTTLWVGTYNPALNLYTKIGFAPDGLEDHILVKREEHSDGS